MRTALICLTTLLSFCLGSLSAAETSAQPNVVFIFADDLGYGDLGCYGATKVQTPHIDRLAAEGRRFTDAHSASAVCTPSRYALLTGEYPHRKGLSKPVFLKTGLVIDTAKQTIGTLMRDAGYATACIGKWHLGFGEKAPDWNGDLKPGPLELGFDYYFGVPVVNSHPPFVYVENHRVVGLVPDDPFVFNKRARTREFFEKMGLDQIGGADKAHEMYDDELVGTTLVERAVKWIGERKDNPFFLYLATTNIHHPFTPHPRFKGTSQCGRYGDYIHELDWIVGEVMKTLEEQDVADNTLVIFTSDNGGMFNVGGQDAWDAGHRLNGDLFGFKFSAWEGGHRVPFIARWPGKIEAGTESSQLISNIDMLATFAALTGGEVGDGQGRDSVNVLPALTGDPAEPLRDHLVLAPSKPSHLAIRQGKWMYIGAQGGGGFTAAKRGGHAFGGPAAVTYAGYVNSDIEDGKIRADAPPAQLYDLETDLAQTSNVIREHPEIAAELEARLDESRGEESTPSGDPGKGKGKGKAKQPAAKVRAGNDRPPNFVIIFTDDQGYGDLSCFGGTHVDTPRIDQMAEEGQKLTSFYVAAPVCTPSRAALMTGCYPKRVDMATGSNFGVLLAGDRKGLNPDEITIAEVLKGAGYRTGMFGKWHLGDQPEFLPTRQGFDEFFGIPYSHDIHPFHPRQDHFKFPPLALLDGEEVIEMDPDADYLTNRFTERAVSFIEKHKDEPFFLYLPHPIPHKPLHVAPPFMKDVPDDVSAKLEQEGGSIDYKTRDRLFLQAIREIDWSVGEILDALDRAGVDEDTFVIFTSDNGPAIGQAGPLRGRKGSTFEGGMREATVVRWPGKIPAGKENAELMTAMDLLPTFARLAGAAVPGDRVIDGKDIWPVLAKGESSPHEVFFYHGGNTLRAVRSGNWKLHWDKGKPTQLYNLDTDIGEKKNLIDAEPEVVERLTEHLRSFERDIAENSRPAAFVDDAVPLARESR